MNSILLCIAALAVQTNGPLELNNKTYDQWRSQLQPKVAELRWQEMPWRTSVYQALQDAQASGRPLLVWAEVGHPLGLLSPESLARRKTLWEEAGARKVASERFVPLAVDLERMRSMRDPMLTDMQGSDAEEVGPGVYLLEAGGKRIAAYKQPEPGDLVEALKAVSVDDPKALPNPPRPAPQNTTRLRVVARDVPIQEDAPINLDYATLTLNEALEVVPSDSFVGAVGDVSPVVLRRLARLSLLDVARGRAPSFEPSEVRTARMKVRLVAREGDVLVLRYEGQTAASAQGTWTVNGQSKNRVRGVDLEFQGGARWDTMQARFTQFEWVALGSRWGATEHNGRSDEKPSKIGFLIQLAPESYAFGVPSGLTAR